jgi:hypothetical protein
MDKLKQGDKVRLKSDLPVPDGEALLQAGAPGVILDVDGEGYTVVFEGHIMPVAYLNDEDVELDEEQS